MTKNTSVERNKLPLSFYQDQDVVKLSRELIGMVLCTRIDGIYTSGVITETEAYAGAIDKASHAYNNRRTSRTEIMFSEGGVSYVYLCYGIHHLFNVVTASRDVPHAILIRSVFPLEGLSEMYRRRNSDHPPQKLTVGPGNVSKALGISVTHTGVDLTGNSIWIEDRGIRVPSSQIETGPRVGIDYAGEDALLPYRFRVTGNLNLTFGE